MTGHSRHAIIQQGPNRCLDRAVPIPGFTGELMIMRCVVLLCVVWGSLTGEAAAQGRQNSFKFYPFQNFQFNFDRDAPFKANDFGEQFFRQFLGDRQGTKRQLQQITVSVADERKIGENQFQMFERYLRSQRIKLSDKGRDAIYVRRLVARLRPLMKNHRRYKSIQVHIADSPHTDARAFPGGKIVVFRGLLGFVESEAALVGILGHELSHIDRQHQLEQFKNSLLAQKTLRGGAVDFRQFANFGQLMMKSFMTPFAADQEREADADGGLWSYRLGYDPLEMARVFQRLHDRDKNRQVPLPSFLRSHPFHIDRFKAIRDAGNKMIAANPDKQLVVGRDNLRQRKPFQ